jgi:pimeloyl-ACP methyl ester carboxylesterase
MKKPLFLLTLIAAPLAAALAADWERKFAQDMSSTDTNVRWKAVHDLDPSDKKQREMLVGILDKENWHVRTAAIERLGTASGDGEDELKKDVEKHSSPLVREGLVYALGATADRVNDVIPALGDKQAIVRRAASIAISRHPTKEGITALIAALGKEKEDFDVKVFLKDALEKATGQFLGNSAVDWKNWWSANQESWHPKEERKPGEGMPGQEGEGQGEGEKKKDEPKSEEEKKAEEEGKKATESTTQLRDVELNFKEAGRGGPLFVMPDMYRNRCYMEKHFAALEDVCHIFYIDLPEISKFKGLKNVGATGAPYYPLEKLADAFDELRQQRKQEKIAILGQGMAGWVAMKYAMKYPKNVSHLILMSTWSSNKAWEDGRNRIEMDGKKRGDPEQEHYAMHKVVDFNTGKHRYEPKDPQEEEALHRMDWTLFFADMRSAYCSLWYNESFRNMGGCIIPDFDIQKEKGNSEVPTFVMIGTHPRSLWTSSSDLRGFQKFFAHAEFLECPHSAQMPHIEDFDLFNKGVHAFFKKYPFKKAKS